MAEMNKNNEHLEKLWAAGEYIQLGETLCDLIPVNQQPMWFSTLLEIASPYADENGAIDNFLEAIYSEECLARKEFFSSFRAITLEYSRSGEADDRKICTILLAENIAKLAFNCAQEWQAGFDPVSGLWIHNRYKTGGPGFHGDAGHSIPKCVKSIIDCSHDNQINDALLNHLLMKK